MRKWFATPLFLLLALVMIFSGCSSSSTTTSSTTAQSYGTITATTASFGTESMDPNAMGAAGWVWAVFDPLIRANEDMTFGPNIADSWSLSDNGCVWTFKIHKGITFSNGDPLTAADVKYSVDRFGSPTSGSAWSQFLSAGYNKVDSRVVDDYTFEYQTASPEATLVACFSNTYILDKTQIDKVGEEEYFKNPVGCGHWIFEELVSKTSIKFKANTSYFHKDEIPAFEYYVELCVPEQATRIDMLKTGECDIAYGISYDRFKDLENQGFTTIISGINGTDSLCFQGTWFPNAGPTGDIRVRQAMSYALNRQEICDNWYQGFATPGGQFFEPKGVFGWTDELKPDPYDKAKAQELLAEAGYPASFSDPVIHMYFPNSADQNYFQLVISYWTAVGLQIKAEPVDLSVYYGYLFHNFSGRIQETDVNVGWLFPWESWSYPNSVYHSANMYTSKGVHGTGNDAKADELYYDVTHQKDYSIADKNMQKFELYVKTLYVNIGIVEYEPIYIYNPNTLGAWNGRNWDGIYSSLAGIQHPTK
jgi:peptide/nickel transport system substrate-binding protein